MGRVVHFEIHADDPQRAVTFYQSLFGWEFTSWGGPMEYWLIKTGDDAAPGINGGLMKRQHPISGNDGVIGYICTIQVDDLDGIIDRAVQLGGAIALAKMPVPGVGWLAYIKDTEGNILGAMQPQVAS